MESKILYKMRKEYTPGPLTEDIMSASPFIQFDRWFEDAKKEEKQEANAMVLSTSTPDGSPSSRVVLLKSFSGEGFVFFTNYNSRKGREISENPKGAILFFWPQAARQVRIEGILSKIDAKESDDYFLNRPAESRASAILSKQSQILNDKNQFDEAVKAISSHESLKRPDFWGGYILSPHYFEFWQGALSRSHDRFAYKSINGIWSVNRLYP